MLRFFCQCLTRLIIFSTIFCCSSASATALKYRGFSEMVSAADAILQGQVEEIQSRRLANGTIVTFVTLSNLVLHRGEYSPAKFTLVRQGGEVNGLVQKIQGAPEFQLSQNLILFLQGNGQRMVPITGWGQGMFVVNNELVHDYQLNPILAINNDQIQINRLTKPDVVLVGAPEPLAMPDISTPMTAMQFIQAIKDVPQNKAIQPLNSVQPSSYRLPRHNANQPMQRQ